MSTIAEQAIIKYRELAHIVKKPDDFWAILQGLDSEFFTLSKDFGDPVFIVFSDHSSLMLTPDGNLYAGKEIEEHPTLQ